MEMKTKKTTSSSAVPYILAKPGLISSEQKDLCSSKVGSWNAGGQSAGDTATHLQETVRAYPSVHSHGFYNLLGKPVSTKTDEFPENFRRGGGSFPI